MLPFLTPGISGYCCEPLDEGPDDGPAVSGVEAGEAVSGVEAGEADALGDAGAEAAAGLELPVVCCAQAPGANTTTASRPAAKQPAGAHLKRRLFIPLTSKLR
jgi:hypothetical protein